MRLVLPVLSVGMSFLMGIVIAQTWFYPEVVQSQPTKTVAPVAKPPPVASAPGDYTADFSEAAVRAVLQSGGRYLGGDLYEWMRRLAEKDWARAKRLFVGDPHLMKSDMAVRALMGELWRWAKDHPEGLISIASDTKLPLSMQQVRVEALRLMMSKDPLAAWAIYTRDRANLGPYALNNIVGEWARVDGHAAVTFGRTLTPGQEQVNFMSCALNQWLEDHPREGYAWIIAQSDVAELREFVTLSRWSEIGRTNPSISDVPFDKLEAYATLIPNLLTDEWRAESLFRYLWLSPVAREHAEEWIARIADEKMRDSAWVALIAEVAKTDIAAAAHYSGNIADPARMAKLTSTFAAVTAQSAPDQAWAYAQSLPDETARASARLSALATWRLEQPDLADAFAFDHASEMTAPELASYGMELAHDYQPERGIEIAALARDELERAAAVAAVMDRWASDAPKDRLLEWTKGLPGGPLRDAAIAGAATVYELGSRAMLDLALSVRHPVLRQHAIEDAVRHWIQHDLPAARAWVLSPAARLLPAASQSRLRQQALHPLFVENLYEHGNSMEVGGSWTELYY